MYICVYILDLNEVMDKMIENESIINMVETLRKLQIGKHFEFSRCNGGKRGSSFGVNHRIRVTLFVVTLFCFSSKLKNIIKGTYFYDVHGVQDKNA